jgi:hypothetical protein
MPEHPLYPGLEKEHPFFEGGSFGLFGEGSESDDIVSWGFIEIYDGLVRWMGWALGQGCFDGVGVWFGESRIRP